MSVKIGHASISETGGINGAKGDSTGKEVCTRDWYDKDWDYMALHPDADVREGHAQAVEDACENDNMGYGQNDRNTAHTEYEKAGSIKAIKTKCNTDCSALQNLAALQSKAPGVTYGTNGWTTSTMKAALKKAGYKIITEKTYLKSAAYCVRGAMYVKEGKHTVCGLTNGSKASETLAKCGISEEKKYYDKYTGSSTSIVDALAAVGESDTSKTHRTKIATANGITSYTGSAAQNTKLLTLLKKGKLIKA
jgi:hypothetical protein